MISNDIHHRPHNSASRKCAVSPRTDSLKNVKYKKALQRRPFKNRYSSQSSHFIVEIYNFDRSNSQWFLTLYTDWRRERLSNIELNPDTFRRIRKSCLLHTFRLEHSAKHTLFVLKTIMIPGITHWPKKSFRPRMEIQRSSKNENHSKYYTVPAKLPEIHATLSRQLPNQMSDILHSACHSGFAKWTHLFSDSSYRYDSKTAASIVKIG